jgi:hypothetical protein
MSGEQRRGNLPCRQAWLSHAATHEITRRANVRLHRQCSIASYALDDVVRFACRRLQRQFQRVVHNDVERRPTPEEQFMATNVATSPDTIARQFADAIRENPTVEQLWLFTNNDAIELWVITGPIGGEDEQRIYEEAVILKERHPSVHIRPLVLNPCFFVEGTNLESVVRAGARRIELRR